MTFTFHHCRRLPAIIIALLCVSGVAIGQDTIVSKDSAIIVPVQNPLDPAYVVQPGTGYDGVVYIELGDGSGTGSLLWTGKHIITAAHLWDEGNQTISTSEIAIIFNLPSGMQTIPVKSFTIHPDYDEEVIDFNYDIAIIELAVPAPADADRYEIYRQSDEIGKLAIITGYGLSGTGLRGQNENDETIVLRKGENVFDDTGIKLNEILGTEILPGSQLIYDFDDGTTEHDASGIVLGVPNLGRGTQEVIIGSGDSGGPAFIDGKVAGIHSYGLSLMEFEIDEIDVNPDIDSETNATFGEFAANTRVSFFAGWVDQIIGQSPPTSSATDWSLYK